MTDKRPSTHCMHSHPYRTAPATNPPSNGSEADDKGDEATASIVAKRGQLSARGRARNAKKTAMVLSRRRRRAVEVFETDSRIEARGDADDLGVRKAVLSQDGKDAANALHVSIVLSLV